MGKEPDKYTGNNFKSAFVASAIRDERESRESRPGDETNGNVEVGLSRVMKDTIIHMQ